MHKWIFFFFFFSWDPKMLIVCTEGFAVLSLAWEQGSERHLCPRQTVFLRKVIKDTGAPFAKPNVQMGDLPGAERPTEETLHPEGSSQPHLVWEPDGLSLWSAASQQRRVDWSVAVSFVLSKLSSPSCFLLTLPLRLKSWLGLPSPPSPLIPFGRWIASGLQTSRPLNHFCQQPRCVSETQTRSPNKKGRP